MNESILSLSKAISRVGSLFRFLLLLLLLSTVKAISRIGSLSFGLTSAALPSSFNQRVTSTPYALLTLPPERIVKPEGNQVSQVLSEKLNESVK